MLKISQTDRIINQSVLKWTEKEKKLLTTIRDRKLENMGHIVRNNQRYKILQLKEKSKEKKLWEEDKYLSYEYQTPIFQMCT